MRTFFEPLCVCLMLLGAACDAGATDAPLRRPAERLNLAEGPDNGSAPLDAYVAAAEQKFSVQLAWISGEPRSGDLAAARLTFLNAGNKAPVQLGEVQVAAFMPAHTHPPRQAQVTRSEALPVNVIDVAGINILMSGHWQLDVHAVVDGQQDVAHLGFDVP